MRKRANTFAVASEARSVFLGNPALPGLSGSIASFMPGLSGSIASFMPDFKKINSFKY